MNEAPRILEPHIPHEREIKKMGYAVSMRILSAASGACLAHSSRGPSELLTRRHPAFEHGIWHFREWFD
jgi:hypothetical protein